MLSIADRERVYRLARRLGWSKEYCKEYVDQRYGTRIIRRLSPSQLADLYDDLLTAIVNK